MYCPSSANIRARIAIGTFSSLAMRAIPSCGLQFIESRRAAMSLVILWCPGFLPPNFL